ncbi:hypothetical protein [Mycobacterium sp. AT1]|uniref:hypothetical protein n=1 Tax=Mycobacterium sp. AT1 TaxID=1961706 RepID=UPI0011505A7D|nr:hypothetical protein [Mycobacterium sp. AT1]
MRLPGSSTTGWRRSAIAPGLPANVPEPSLPVAEALAHGTKDAAHGSRFDQLAGQPVTFGA